MADANVQSAGVIVRRLNWAATASVVCGALAALFWVRGERMCMEMNRSVLPLIGLFLFVPAALYLGHSARRTIGMRPNRLKGRLLAFIGLILSYLILVSGLNEGIRLALQSSRAKSECAAIGYLKRIVRAETSYFSRQRQYAGLDNLVEARLLDPRFMKPIQNYQFSVVSSGSGYTASAVPVYSSSGVGYYATADGVVRHAFPTSMAPSGQPVE